MSTDRSPIFLSLIIFSSSDSLLDKMSDASLDKVLINSDALFDQELFVKTNKINKEKNVL